MEDVFNDESENISLSQLLDIPTQQLILEEVQHNNRFSAPVSYGELQNQKELSIPKTTRQSNHWALEVWTEWVKYRNARPETMLESGGVYIPEDIYELSIESLNFWLQRFVPEIRKKTGTDYPPITLTQIIAGLQRHLRNRCSDRTFNFFKEGDLDFIEFRRALDGRMKFLTSQGIGIQKKSCDPVTLGDEVKMCDTGVFFL